MKRCVVVVAVLFAAACSAQSPTPAPTRDPVTPTLAAPSRQPAVSPTAQTLGAEEAIRLVMASSDGSMFAVLFPKTVGARDCEIYRGGPYPGKLLPGVCRTEVDAARSDRSDYLVKFTQVWDAKQFHAFDDPSSGDLHYTWSFLVTNPGTVVAQPPSGNFPPQYVR